MLGPVKIVCDGAAVDVDAPKHRALLATLALNPGEVVSVSGLIDALWGDQPPATAEKTLQTYVSALRKQFGGDIIMTHGGGYQLGPDVGEVDAIQLDDAVVAGRAHLGHGDATAARRSFTAALALWRGNPLDDLAAGSTRDGQVARLDELRLLAREGLIEAELDSGHHREVVPGLERLVSEQPFREVLWRSLMVAQYRSGRAADALRTYQRLRTNLVDELGIEPSETTQSLEARILDHDPALDPPAATPPTNLAAPLDSFVGRAAECDTIVDVLAGHRLATVLGIGGVGKSRLANEVARAVLSDTPGGVWWVDLGATTEVRPVLMHVAAAMELPPAPGDVLGTVLLARLRDRPTLLVLDNCEHIREAVASFVEWVTTNDPLVRVLATSRVPLDVAGEFRVQIEPLAIEVADGHSLSAAGRLFFERASARTDMKGVDDADIEAVTDIVGGLPLGIELAAAQCAMKTPAEIAIALHDRAALLELSGSRRDGARHASLGHVLDTSVEALEPDLVTPLARLTVFPGDFDLAAVRPVTALPATDAERLVSRLLDTSLLARVSPGGRRRFRVLWPVREYLSGRLAGADRDEAEAAHGEHFRSFVGRFVDEADTPNEQAWFNQFLGEEHNVRTALAWFERHDPNSALTFGPALAMASMSTGDQIEGSEIVRRLLGASTDPSSSLVAWTECELQWPEFLSGDVEAALGHGSDAIARFEQLGDERGLSGALRSQAHALHLGGVDEATTTPLYRRSIDVAEAAGLPYSLALAEVCFAQGLAMNDALNVADVEAMLAHAESVLRPHSAHGELAHIELTRAMTAFGRADFAAARSAAEMSLFESRLGGYVNWEQIARVSLGVVAHEEGDTSLSRRELRRAVQLAADTANHLQLGVAFHAVSAATAEQAPESAARIWGAGDARAPQYPIFARRYSKWMEPARSELGARFDELVAEGAQLSLNDAVALADSIL